MFNHLRMDLRRLTRTKSFYFSMLAIVVVLGFLTGTMLFVLNHSPENFLQMIRSGNPESVQFNPSMFPSGMLKSAAASMRSLVNTEVFLTILSEGGFIRILFVIVYVTFIGRDYQTGYLKNLLSLKRVRANWILSRVIIALVISIALNVVLTLLSMAATAFVNGKFAFNAANALPFLGVQTSGHLALAGIALVMTTLSQSRTAALLVTLLLSFNIQSAVYMLIDLWGILPFKIAEYGIINRIGRYKMAQPLSQAWDASYVALIAFLVFIFLSWLITKKRDYKC